MKLTQFSVSLDKIVKELKLEVLYTPTELEKIPIYTEEVNRPGLLLSAMKIILSRTAFR